MFHATFGKHGFTWTFRPTGLPFDRTENFEWRNNRFDQEGSESRKGYGENSFAVGSYDDRKVLGLPTAGPLKIEDVKAAFRASALKWHPDKHQGLSKEDAEKKFKHCVDAYRSLCDSFSTA
ncbi:heat shock protein binding protein [Striga asiatica]|uniref:Heat shock protein binding protein n=1 Tax=Striga asiatica TaxID=4170 RepID=A0A5A7PWE6_STRAF|nr:heat shock protein binding protein [Striga asiatica]